jgi:hypothetical protein
LDLNRRIRATARFNKDQRLHTLFGGPYVGPSREHRGLSITR